jgi:hypothetical protein
MESAVASHPRIFPFDGGFSPCRTDSMAAPLVWRPLPRKSTALRPEKGPGRRSQRAIISATYWFQYGVQHTSALPVPW